MNAHTSDADICICPSFNCYSSDRLAEIAVKVAAEDKNNNNDDEEEEEEEFVFTLLSEKDGEFLADSNGPVYPVFNRNIRLNNDDNEFISSTESITPIPLSQLFLEDRQSCTSSDADESENIPACGYGVWKPKPIETAPSPTRCNKSKSTGSVSKRWKFRDLLLRSNSEGKDSYVFLTPKKKKVTHQLPVSGGKPSPSPSPHEALYVRNRAETEGNKKKSYLPYRKDLVGFFSKSFPHF